jgi:hypothetical protein
MDIANQFLQVGILLADDGFVAILKQMAITDMATIEIDHISGEESPHAGGQGVLFGLAEEMEVIGEERPSIEGQGAFLGQGR